MTDRLIGNISRLTGDNYHDWKFAVSMVLRSRGCWNVVNGETIKPEDETKAGYQDWIKKSEDGLTIIGLTIDPTQYTYIRDSTTGPDAWSKLKEAHEKNTRSTRISLKRQFYGFHHDTNTPIQTYISGITDLASKLKGIGIELSDDDIVDVLIFNLDPEYSNIASSLMAVTTELKVSTVTGALLEEERRKGVSTSDLGSSLYAGGPPPGSRRGPNRHNTDTRVCFRCGRMGHKLRDCRARTAIDGKPITQEMELAAEKEISKFRESSTLAVNQTLNDASY